MLCVCSLPRRAAAVFIGHRHLCFCPGFPNLHPSYLTANIHYDPSGVAKPSSPLMGRPYRLIPVPALRGQMLALGFLYWDNTTGPNVLVDSIPETVARPWFAEALATPDLKLVVVLGLDLELPATRLSATISVDCRRGDLLSTIFLGSGFFGCRVDAHACTFAVSSSAGASSRLSSSAALRSCGCLGDLRVLGAGWRAAHMAWDSPELAQIKAAIRQRLPSIPLVLLTGHSHIEKIQRSTNLTADPFINVESGCYFREVGVVTLDITVDEATGTARLRSANARMVNSSRPVCRVPDRGEPKWVGMR